MTQPNRTAKATDSADPSTRPSAARDFDFLVGTWRSRQRRLKARLQASNDWETFDAACTVHALPGGVTNFDTLVAEAWRPGWVGMSFRVFNPKTDLWSIYWCTNDGSAIDAATGRLDAPVVGRFDGDVGDFEGDDIFEGRSIRVRYTWKRLGPNAAQWQQAFSADGGVSWEVNWVMDFERVVDREPDRLAAPTALLASACADIDCEVVELRQYQLHPGQREPLIDLFDREFVETQEAVGMSVMGQFRNLDAADNFVWLRGFPDMPRRAESLAAFYGGPVWAAHRGAANATMIESDNVLLLRPAWPGAGISMRGRQRAHGLVRSSLPGLVEATVFPLREAAAAELLRCCRDILSSAMIRSDRSNLRLLGWYMTETAPNNFPRLPVREGEPVLVSLVMFDGPEAALAHAVPWRSELHSQLERWLSGPPIRLRGLCRRRAPRSIDDELS